MRTNFANAIETEMHSARNMQDAHFWADGSCKQTLKIGIPRFKEIKMRICEKKTLYLHGKSNNQTNIPYIRLPVG